MLGFASCALCGNEGKHRKQKPVGKEGVDLLSQRLRA